MNRKLQSFFAMVVLGFGLVGCAQLSSEGGALDVAPALDAKFLGAWNAGYGYELTGNNWSNQIYANISANKISKLHTINIWNIEDMQTNGFATDYSGGERLEVEFIPLGPDTFQVLEGIEKAVTLQPALPEGGHFGAGVRFWSGIYKLRLAEDGGLIMTITSELDGHLLEERRFFPRSDS